MQRIAINGFGRIGRNVLRAWIESFTQYSTGIEIVAINDVVDVDTLLHLLRFDSTHGPLQTQVEKIKIDQQDYLQFAVQDQPYQIRVIQQSSPELLPWAELNVDVVLECSGQFRSYLGASCHLQAGSHRVVIGAAPFDEVDAAIVYGVNHDQLSEKDRVISSVSCTTQALVPLVKILHDHFSIESAMMTEIHAVTADQNVLDQPHRDWRRARAFGNNIIPTTSSAIGALKKVLPAMADRVDGYSIRVPTMNVAAIDLSLQFDQAYSAAQINQVLSDAAKNDYSAIMQVTDQPLVSSDFNHSPYSLIVDLLQTMTVGRQAKVFAWYDNEWGYANRLLDLCCSLDRI